MGFGVLLGMGLVGMVVLVFSPTAESQPESPAHFLFQRSVECLFGANESQAGSGPTPPPPAQVRLLDRYIYDRQEFVRFDSDRGEFEAVTALGEPSARYWNRRAEVLEDRRKAVDFFCRPNYGIDDGFAQERRVQPRVKIAPSSYASSSSHNTLLICTVDRFWPSGIEITWFRNGQEENETRVFTTGLIRNGDWTFQVAVMLETRPERGDLYACRVEHASFPEPVSVQWGPESDSARRSKWWAGLAGMVLGLASLAPGLLLYLKAKKVAFLH